MREKEKIKKIVIDLLENSHRAMVEKIDRVLDSDAVDTSVWDEGSAPMILPKTIVTALLQEESTQYLGAGTSYEKQVKKDAENIRHSI